jgi:hypothetical protein
MGSKFRLSPMMETYVSHRPEDKNRDKNRQNTENTYQTRSKGIGATKEAGVLKIGPPKQSTERKKVTFEGRQPEQERAPESSRKRDLPYVEVAPLKTALRAPRQSDQSTKITPSYKSLAPVEVGLDVEKLVETVLDLEINVPLRNLAGVSSAIQKEIRKQVTKTRLPVATNSLVHRQEGEDRPYVRIDNLPVGAYLINKDTTEDFPEGHLVADDPVLQYLAENRDANSSDLIVAKESEPLRTVFITVNRIGQEACLLDSGSMIVSMAKDVAVQLGLTWDPTIQINMESASNHIEKTLGLARNVRFGVGGLDLFLQVHIMENPPYRVLLGRPFDAFASSTLQTNPDGSSMLTVVDPNTKGVAIIPTYPRGVSPEELQKQKYQAFC